MIGIANTRRLFTYILQHEYSPGPCYIQPSSSAFSTIVRSRICFAIGVRDIRAHRYLAATVTTTTLLSCRPHDNGTSSPEEQAALYNELNPELIYFYCTLSSAVILIFDQIITISDEVDHIWKRKFTGATLLYFLNRYTTLLKTLILLTITWATSVEVCRLGELWYNIFDLTALYVFAAFSAFRVWAIWGREIRPFIIVLAFALVTPCLNTYRVSVESTLPTLSPLPPPFGGCQYDYGMPLSLFERFADIVRGIAIATDALVLIMTWMRTRDIYRAAVRLDAKPPVSTLLIRDGSLYFGVLLIFNIVDVIVSQTDPGFNPVNLYNDVVNSILISRFMLNLRAVHSSESGSGDTAYTQGHVDFVHAHILGDLSSSIDFSASAPSSNHSEPFDDSSDNMSGFSASRERVCVAV